MALFFVDVLLMPPGRNHPSGTGADVKRGGSPGDTFLSSQERLNATPLIAMWMDLFGVLFVGHSPKFWPFVPTSSASGVPFTKRSSLAKG